MAGADPERRFTPFSDIDRYDSPDAEALLHASRSRDTRKLSKRRELITQAGASLGFLIAASLIAALVPWHKTFSLSTLALVLATWLVVERVKFPVADGWTAPTMLVFVPALFVLPTPVVPLVAMSALVLGRVPELVQGHANAAWLPRLVGDGWYTIGPTAVLLATGTTAFAWSHWPAYLLALLAQFLFDIVASTGRAWIGEGIKPSVQLPFLTWIYITDALLAPIGLLIAAAAVDRPGLIVLALCPAGMLWLFARERQQRMDETLALSTAYRGTAMLLGDVVEADHHYTGAHSRDVVDLSLAVAGELDLDATKRRRVEFAALLHDVGKIQVPKEIINKPAKLDEQEWEIMRRHTIDGERMLKQVGGLLASVGGIVRSSHEHFDGGGYPDGLKGEEIPIEARIVTACDAYSAMTTTRAYREAMSVRDALIELRRCAGSQFDPVVVSVLERAVVASHPLPEDDPDARTWLDQLGAAPGSVHAATTIV